MMPAPLPPLGVNEPIPLDPQSSVIHEKAEDNIGTSGIVLGLIYSLPVDGLRMINLVCW